MAAQQETAIGDDDLDALMAELETETAGMVSPPPAIKVTAAIVVEDDPLAGLDEDPTDPRDEGIVDLDTDEQLTQAIAAANAGSAAPEPSIDDEMAALEAEFSDAAAPATPAAAPSMAAKIAAKAKAAAESYPSDVPKVMKVKEGDAFIAPPGVTVEHVPVADLDAELAEIAAKMPTVVTTPKNPNPPASAPVRPGAALAGLGFEIDIDQFRRDISVTENNLDTCMMEQAGLIAWYIAQHAQAEAQAARTKVQVEMGEAKLYAQHRENAVGKAAIDSSFKVTEKVVENAVRMDPKYGAIQNRLIEAETRAAIWKGCVEGLKQRRDMIIQLGADRREDGKGTVRILAKEQSHADLKAAAIAAAKRN